MPKPAAIWNSARDVWETPQTEGFFCEHLDVFLETFPTSGMTVNGAAYELPTWEPATDDSASSSLLPTVTVQDGANNGGPSQFERNTPPLNTRVLMLPTPTVSDTNGPGKHGDGGMDLRTTVSLLPTPVAQPSGNTPQEHLRKKPGRKVVTDLAILTENGLLETGGRLLPTPRAQHGEDRNNNIYPRPLDQPQNLENSLARLLPTPSACVANDGESTETWLARREKVKLTAANGNGMGMPLTIATLLIGASTSQLSDAGNASLDGQLPGQQSLLDAMEDTA